MRPFKWLVDTLNRTSWWLLWGGGLMLMVLFTVVAIPVTFFSYEGIGDASREVVKRELGVSFGREALKTFARTAANFRDDVPEDAEARIDQAISDVADAQLELKAARRSAAEAKTPEQVEMAKAELEAANKYYETTTIQLGHVLEGIFGVSDTNRIKFDLDDDAGGIIIGENSKKSGKSDISANFGDDEATSAKPTVPAAVPPKPRADKSSNATPKVNADKINVKDAAKGGKTTKVSTQLLSVDAIPDAPERLFMRVNGVRMALDSQGQFTIEQRAELDRRVRLDWAKLLFSAVMIPIIFIVLVLLSVIKFYTGRTKAAQRVAAVSQEEAERTRLREQITQARLQALQAQVEPHFLYNTLANVQALTEVDPAAANKMVGHLIEYLRAALPKMREATSTVGQEVELARAYLNILQMRMGKRLTFEISVPQALLSTPFPPMMLPSLVENAIKHGLEPQREGGSIVISATSVNAPTGQRIRLSVADTGKGFGEAKSATAGGGVGLTNIRERLAALFNDQGQLVLEANSPKGVVSTIDVPIGPAVGSSPAAALAAQKVSSETGTFAKLEPAPIPYAQKTWWGKLWHVVAICERAWRKTMSFVFIALVTASVVVSLAMLWSLATGSSSLYLGGLKMTGSVWSFFLGIIAVIAAFVAMVIASGLTVVVLYGVGWLTAILIATIVPITLISTIGPFLIPIVFMVGVFYLINKYINRNAGKKQPRAPAASPTTPTGADAIVASAKPPINNVPGAQ